MLRDRSSNRSLWIAVFGSFVLLLSVGVALAIPLPKVDICHKGNTINISANALPAHLAHGDTVGACGNVCACQPSIDPVFCTSTGRTYINPCTAACDGATGCDRVCACQPEINAVICSSGNTYINQCVADCAGATGCTEICPDFGECFNYTICGNSGPLGLCANFETAEGCGGCIEDFVCGTRPACGSSADCPAGESCVVNTCCVGNPSVCVPNCTDSNSLAPSVISGGEATGSGR